MPPVIKIPFSITIGDIRDPNAYRRLRDYAGAFMPMRPNHREVVAVYDPNIPPYQFRFGGPIIEMGMLAGEIFQREILPMLGARDDGTRPFEGN